MHLNYSDRAVLVDCVQQAVTLLHEPASYHLTRLITDDVSTDEMIKWFDRPSGKPCPAPERPPYRPGTQARCGHYYSAILGCHPESILREKIKLARVKYAQLLEEDQCQDLRISWIIPYGQSEAAFLCTKDELLAINKVYGRRYSDIGWNPSTREAYRIAFVACDYIQLTYTYSGFNVVLTVDEVAWLTEATPNWPVRYRYNCDWIKKPDPPAAAECSEVLEVPEFSELSAVCEISEASEKSEVTEVSDVTVPFPEYYEVPDYQELPEYREALEYREVPEHRKLPEASVVVQAPESVAKPTYRVYHGELPEVADFLGPLIHRKLRKWWIYGSCRDTTPWWQSRTFPKLSKYPLGSHHLFMNSTLSANKGWLQQCMVLDQVMTVWVLEEEEKQREEKYLRRHMLQAERAVARVAPQNGQQTLSSVSTMAQFERLKQQASARQRAIQQQQRRRAAQEGRRAQNPLAEGRTEMQRRQKGHRNAAPQLQRRITTQGFMRRRQQRPVAASQAYVTDLEDASVSSCDTIAVASGPQHLRELDFASARICFRLQAKLEEACTIPLPDSPSQVSFEEVVPAVSSVNGENDHIDTRNTFVTPMTSVPTASGTPRSENIGDEDENDSADELLHSLMNQCAMPANDSESSTVSTLTTFWSPQKQPLAESTSSLGSTPSRVRDTLATTLLPRSFSSASSIRSCASTTRLHTLNVGRCTDSSISMFERDPGSPPLSLKSTPLGFVRPFESYAHLTELVNTSHRRPEAARSLPNLFRRGRKSPEKLPDNDSYKSLPAEPKLSVITNFPVNPVNVPVLCGFVDGDQTVKLTSNATNRNKTLCTTDDSEEYYTPSVRDFAGAQHPLLRGRRSIDTIRRNRNGHVIARDFYWCPVIGDSLRRFVRSRMVDLGHHKMNRTASCPR